MVVLDSVQAATDLLDKRSQNYSNRPRFVIFELYVLPTSRRLICSALLRADWAGAVPYPLLAMGNGFKDIANYYNNTSTRKHA